MVLVAIAFVAGTVIGRFVLAPVWALLVPALIAATWAAIMLARPRPRASRLPSSGVLLIFVTVLFGWAGSNRAIRIDRQAESIAQAFEPFALTRAEGTIAEIPNRRRDLVNLVLKNARLDSAAAGTGAQPFPLKLLVQIPLDENSSDDVPEFSIGSRIAVWGRVKAPRTRGSPADFDRQRYLAGRGIGATTSVSNFADVELIGAPASISARALSALQNVRAAMIGNIESRLSPERAAIANAVLFGERGNLGEEFYDQLTRAGIVHIISVSGLHTGMILAAILFFGRALRLRPRAAAMLGIASLVVYCALTGFLPPVTRASLMGAFILAGWAMGRGAALWSALALSALVTLALDPRNIVRTDWQLSYASLGAIALLSPVLLECFPKRGDSPLDAMDSADFNASSIARHYVWRPLTAVIAVQIGLLPLQLAYFRFVSIVALVLNPIVVPLVFLMLLGAIAVAVLGAIPFVGAAASAPLNALIAIFEWLIDTIGGVTWAAAEIPAMPAWLIAVYYGALLIGPHLRAGEEALCKSSPRQRRQLLMRMTAAIAVAVWIPAFAQAGTRGMLEVYVLDVGQGDAIVMRFPDEKIAVIDAGRHDYGDQGRLTVAPFLKWLGARRIDLLVATHSDADHIGGMTHLIEQFEVGLFVCGPDDSESHTFREMRMALHDRGVECVQVRAGGKISGFEPVEISVLNPWPGLDNNDSSIVMLVDYSEIEMLLTGDITEAAEREILKRRVAQDIEILKVAHHGSASSSTPEFLDAFRPEVALVSAGRNNVYGHPSPRVVERLRERQISIGRTDKDGTLRITTDGRRYRVDRFAAN